MGKNSAILSILRHFFQKVFKDELLLYAQGLTYNTLLTLIPLLGLLISLGKLFLQEDSLIQHSFNFFANYLTAEALITVMEKIINLVENLKKFPLGKFSLFFYFLMSLGLLFQIEDVLNRIFKSYKKRNLKERLLFYWIALNLAPFLFFFPLFLQTSFHGFLKYSALLYVAFLLLFFYLLYTYFPARRVSKLSALLGSAFATFLWFLFSYLFKIYVKNAISYSKLYGSLSVVPIFILFLFLNWLIFLFGAEISYFFERKPWKKKALLLGSPLKELIVLLYLAKGFSQGEPLEFEKVYSNLSFSEEELLEILRTLEEKGFIFLRDEEIFFRVPLEKIEIGALLSFNHKKIEELIEILNLDLKSLLLFREDFVKKILKEVLEEMEIEKKGGGHGEERD